jgi:hypothetical protein
MKTLTLPLNTPALGRNVTDEELAAFHGAENTTCTVVITIYPHGSRVIEYHGACEGVTVE